MERLTAPSWRLILVVCAIMAPDPPRAQEMHEWRYRDTGETFRAELKGAVDGQLRLLREDGKTVTVAPQRLSLADLVYAFERIQEPPAPQERSEGAASAARAEGDSSMPPADAAPPTKAPGTCEIEIESRKTVEEDVAQRIKKSLLVQFTSRDALPENTTTFVRLRYDVRNEKIEVYRIGKHSFLINDVVARWGIDIRRKPADPRSVNVPLHSDQLKVTGIETLGGPPKMLKPAIGKNEITEIVHKAAIEAICGWRIPEEVFAAKEE